MARLQPGQTFVQSCALVVADSEELSIAVVEHETHRAGKLQRSAPSKLYLSDIMTVVVDSILDPRSLQSRYWPAPGQAPLRLVRLQRIKGDPWTILPQRWKRLWDKILR